jgi:hypothetical protein
MNKKQHEKWLKKHGCSHVQIKKAKVLLGNPNKLPSYREELSESNKIRRVASLSNSIPENGTKDAYESQLKEKVSSSYPIMPAYNKGPVMVVSISELPYAGKKL